MKKYQHILFAADLTDDCHSLAKQAAEFAGTMGAKLSLIHVIEPLPAYGFMIATEVPAEHLIESASEEMNKLGSSLGTPIENVHIETGATKHVILEAANEMGIDLIIVGSHGKHGLADLLGSTANAIINSASCDVLTLRAHNGE